MICRIDTRAYEITDEPERFQPTWSGARQGSLVYRRVWQETPGDFLRMAMLSEPVSAIDLEAEE